jgi:phytoene synthase
MQASQRNTRNSASNLAMAFILLPKAKRESMSALYAFCREVDDVADEDPLPVEQRRSTLEEWRLDIQAACAQGQPRFKVNQALQPVIARYHLPFPLFEELIHGVAMDLNIQRYASYGELELYCYRVASVVGLLSIEIFGYQDPACREYAVALGQALQLTNILRDVYNDAQRGRIYLPQEALRRFGISENQILDGRLSPSYQDLAREVAGRARQYYQKARQSLPAADRETMIAAELMGAVYWQLLLKLERLQFNVFRPQTVRVGNFQKLLLILRTWRRVVSGSPQPNYGG